MKTFLSIALATVVALSAGVPAASAAAREYEGTVVSVDRDARTFRLRDSERGTVTIKVTSSTRFERVTFGSLKAGARRIEAIVRRANGRWVATKIERSGGDHDAGDDHGRGRGSDH